MSKDKCPFTNHFKNCTNECAFYVNDGCVIVAALSVLAAPAPAEPKQAVLEFDNDPAPMPAVCNDAPRVTESDKDKAVRDWAKSKPVEWFAGKYTINVFDAYLADVDAGKTPNVGVEHSRYLTYRVKDETGLKVAKNHQYGLMRFVAGDES